MCSLQIQRAEELISQIGRPVCLKKRHNGYEVYKPGPARRIRIGYVRFNMNGQDPGMYRVYVYRWKCGVDWTRIIDPGDDDAIKRVIAMFRSSYDRDG